MVQNILEELILSTLDYGPVMIMLMMIGPCRICQSNINVSDIITRHCVTHGDE